MLGLFGFRIVFAGLAVGLLTGAAVAGDVAAPAAVSQIDQKVFGFAGLSVDEDMLHTANLFGADYEDNVLAGVGYQRFFYETLDISIGAEVGVAGRFGDRNSAEFWGGVVARYDGLVLGDRLKIAPALTFGLSAITDTMAGREERLEAQSGGDATLLFYLSPEINFSLADRPDVEVFWRLHHRSGAKGTLGDMEGAANANVFGVRVGF